jgi:hypothetical protein
MANDYFMVSLKGGDDRPVFTTPPTTVEHIRELYPQALAVVAISQQDFKVLCDRQKRMDRVFEWDVHK